MSADAPKDDYALAGSGPTGTFPAPELPYKPRDPRHYRPKIGLIGCGGISETHLTAYKRAGYDVVALCSRSEEKARRRQQQFYPDARIYKDFREVLGRDDVEVVDVTAHPADRIPVVEAALNARKHVLSQKPFILKLEDGLRLADLADRNGVKLAVNQNGRWAPHWSWIRHAIGAGLIGEPFACHLSVHWDHNWIVGKPFDQIRHIILYDFAIHWCDITTAFFGADRKPLRVYASVARSPSQRASPPLLAQVVIEYEAAQASLAFDGDAKFGPQDRTYVAGTAGTVTSVGPNLGEQTVTLHTARGRATPRLEGTWFPGGFHGTMAELLCAIEENRQPHNNARDNLAGLAICFAAVASAESHTPQVPGSVRDLPV